MRRNFLLTPFLSHPLPVHLEFNTLLEYCFLEHSGMVFFFFFRLHAHDWRTPVDWL